MAIKTDSFLFLAAAIVSAVLGFSIAMMFFAPDAKLSDWLSAAGAALGAALTVMGTFVVTIAQQGKQERIAAEVRAQELRGSRAILLSDLSALIEYLKQCANLFRELAQARSREQRAVVIQPYKLDIAILLRLQKLITLLSPREGAYIAALMSTLQIHQARTQDDYRRIVQSAPIGKLNLLFAGTMEPTISLFIRVSRLFEYARRQTDIISFERFSDKEVSDASSYFDLPAIFQDDVLNAVTAKLVSQNFGSVL